MAEIKIGILGYGFMGHEHMNLLRKIPEISVTAICDIVPSQMDDAPEGITKYTEMDDLINDPSVNTVLIVVPNPLHKEAAIKAARAGKNIICEKPAALTVADFEEMVAEAEKAGVRFTVHQQRRHDRDYLPMKAVLNEGLVGKPYLVRSMMYGVNGNMHDWHIYPEMGGGMLYDWGIHLIDQILNMTGEKVLSVYADIKKVINKDVDDYFLLVFKFESGMTAEIELGTYFLTPKRGWLVLGDTGTAILDIDFVNGMKETRKIVRTKHLLENVPGKITMTSAGPTRSFGPPEPGLLYEEPLPEVPGDELDWFKGYVKAIEDGTEFEITIPQVRRDLKIMDAFRESAKTGKAVEFEA